MQVSSKALDIASIAAGPNAALSVKCLRMGMNTPIRFSGPVLRHVIAHAALASKLFRSCPLCHFPDGRCDFGLGPGRRRSSGVRHDFERFSDTSRLTDAAEAEASLAALLDEEASKLRILDYLRTWRGDKIESAGRELLPAMN
jgi:hypothetical protein